MSETSDRNGEPKLLLPFLKSFYDAVIPLSWVLVRCAVGLQLFVHGTGKINRLPAFAASIAERGYGPEALGYLVFATELVGGACIAAGLFTRFWAAAGAIELGVITLGYLGNGYGWRNEGYEYTLMWGAILFAVALRGGGPLSLDRKLGKEL